MTGTLVDTNILVYAYQPEEGDPRRRRARKVLGEQILLGRGAVSVQNLAEFSRVALQRFDPPLPPSVVGNIIVDLESSLMILRPSAATVKEALGGVDRHKLSFWDSMLWAVARENGIEEILSEDFQSGREIDGVRFRNPLA